jgi:hypothetical protein
MLRNGIPRVCFYFFPQNGIPSIFFSSAERNSESFLFRGMILNGIPRVCFNFCSMVQNSEHSSPLRNVSERHSESFLFRETAGIPQEQTNCSIYSVFRGIIFCRKLPTLLLTVETEVNGDSKSTNERGSSLVGSLGFSCRYKRFLFLLGCYSGPVQNIFFSSPYTISIPL